jgi:YD repeat-containing protein
VAISKQQTWPFGISGGHHDVWPFFGSTFGCCSASQAFAFLADVVRLASARCLTSVNGNTGTTTNAYDKASDLTQVVDPVGNTSSFRYDRAGRQTSAIDPLGHTSTTAYDLKGNPTQTVDADGQTSLMTYDLMDLQTEHWYNANGGFSDTQTFAHDVAGNLTTTGNKNGTYVLNYDASGLVTSVAEPFGAAATFAYDKDGNRTLMTDSFSGTQTAVYDKADRLTSLTYTGQSQTLKETLTYFAGGQVHVKTMKSGTTTVATTTQTVATNGNLTSILYTGSGTIGGFSYGYDSAGRLSSTTANGGATTSYAYDAVGQLTTAGAQSYTFDANGNPTGGSDATGTGNRLTTFVDSSGHTWSYVISRMARTVDKRRQPIARSRG